MKVKIFLSHVFFLTIVAAFYLYRPWQINLTWNMFLALVALDLAYLVVTSKSRLLSWLLLPIWLLFYPNTFYMLTDMIYATWGQSLLTDPSAFKAYLYFVSAVLFGVLSGVESVRLIFSYLKIQHAYLRYLASLVLSFISAIAIHIGRYARLNSWDVFSRLDVVIGEIRSVLTANEMTFIFGFAFVQFLALVMMDRE